MKKSKIQKLINQFLNIDYDICKLLNKKSQLELIMEMKKVFIGNKNNIILPTPKHHEIYNNIKSIHNIPNTKVVLDVETDGFNKIIQICYFIIDDKNNILSKHNYLLCNKGYPIDYYKKIVRDDIKNYGVCPKEMIKKLNNDMKYCDTIIGHNILFDIRKLNKYCEYFGEKFDCPKNIIDTMFSSRKIVCAKNKNNNIKNPKLIELCQFFDITISDDSFHDALYDVQCTFNCYIKLKELI